MVKTNGLAITFLLAAPMILTACTDKDQATDDIKSTSQQQQPHSEPSNLEDLINTENDVHLQDLMHQVAQARRHAEKHGFVWSTTEPLIEKGYASAKAGNEDQAKTFFQDAKLQFKLSIKQAKYAAQHWKLLIPEDD